MLLVGVLRERGKNRGTYLIILVQSLQVTDLAKALGLLVAQADAVVEVSKPNDSIMILYRPVPLEPQAMTNGLVIPITFLVVGESSCKMSSDEDNRSVGVLHTNSNSTFVSRHTGHTSL